MLCPYCGKEIMTENPQQYPTNQSWPVCEHCYCIYSGGGTGTVAHMQCCKCGARMAITAGGTFISGSYPAIGTR